MKSELPLPESAALLVGCDLVTPLLLVRMPCVHGACGSLPKQELLQSAKHGSRSAGAVGAFLVACYCPCVRHTSVGVHNPGSTTCVAQCML